VQGLATAYALAKRGFNNIAVFEKGYVGFGASGRNGALISSTFHTKEWVQLYSLAIGMFEHLSGELGINTLFSKRGGLELICDEEDLAAQKRALEVQHSLALRTRLLSREECADLIPQMNTETIIGAVLNPDSGVIRHDAVLWGYTKKSTAMGAEVYPYTEVSGIHRIADGFAVQTAKGRVECDRLVNAAGADAKKVCAWLGIDLPVWPRRAEALVTEPVKPFLDPFVTYGPLNAYGHQTARGEIVAGTVLDFRESNDLRAGFEALTKVAKAWVTLFPCLSGVNVLRQWAGLPCESPDHSPILGFSGVDGFYLNVGWGGYGFMSGPVVGELLAELILTDKTPALLRPFRFSRFQEGEPMIETALVSHSIWKTAAVPLESVIPNPLG